MVVSIPFLIKKKKKKETAALLFLNLNDDRVLVLVKRVCIPV